MDVIQSDVPWRPLVPIMLPRAPRCFPCWDSSSALRWPSEARSAVASYLRQPWLIMLMWFAGAIYSACGASNVSELATMIPRAGGFYVYAREAMGDYAGFAVGWSDFLGNVAATAYAAMAAVEFLERLIPRIEPFAQVVAAGTILAFAGMQWFGVRLSAGVQQAASAIAAIALFGLVL